MFLAICLRREQALPWADLARLLAGEDGPNWRRLLGFAEGPEQTPYASGLRYGCDERHCYFTVSLPYSPNKQQAANLAPITENGQDPLFD